MEINRDTIQNPINWLFTLIDITISLQETDTIYYFFLKKQRYLVTDFWTPYRFWYRFFGRLTCRHKWKPLKSSMFSRVFLELVSRFGLPTSSLPMKCSTYWATPARRSRDEWYYSWLCAKMQPLFNIFRNILSWRLYFHFSSNIITKTSCKMGVNDVQSR